MTHALSLSALHCPRCGTRMHLGQAGGITMHGCSACGGIWLAPECAARLAQALPQDAIALAARHGASALGHVDTTPGIRCPVCGVPMQRTHAAAAKLDLDVCPTHGTWYDRYELEKVAHAIGKSRWIQRGVVAGTAVAMQGAAIQQQQQSIASGALETGAEIIGEVVTDSAADAILEGAGAILGGAFELLGALFD